MSRSFNRRRREGYMMFPDHEFREVIYSTLKSLQAQGVSISDIAQKYVTHCDNVKKEIPK